MSESDEKKPIAIIGGGFAGTSLLIHTLLRIADDTTLTEPVKITLVERMPEQLHGGVAYSKGAKYGGHNLNAGAHSMDMFPGREPPPGMPGFIDYIKMRAAEHPEVMDAVTNPPRQMVNDYLQYMLALAKDKAGAKAQVEETLKQATHLVENKDGSCTISFSDGSTLEACHANLTTGFQEAVAPKFAKDVADDKRFMDQPYAGKANAFYDDILANQKPDTKVLIVGTGLTAMDIAARLINQGYKGQIEMVSRRGLMHKTYEKTEPEEYLALGHMRGEARPIEELGFSKTRPAFLDAETVGDLVKGIVSEFTSLRAQGYTSPEILMCWERHVPEIAEKFPKPLLADLFRKHEALITSSRVGVTPNTGITVREGIQSGQIVVSNGTIKNVQPGPDGLIVSVNPGNESVSYNQAAFNSAQNRTEEKTYDYVFSAMGNTLNFTGPASDIKDPLWRGLLEDGKATPHWTSAGISVDKQFSLLDKDGNASENISVLGVPVAGHMMVTAYPYPHAPEVQGGKLGPNALGAMTISNEIKMLLDAKYQEMTAGYRPAPQDNAALKRQKVNQPAA